MKKLIIVTLITTCAALCAAVWPHNNATEQTPVPAAETVERQGSDRCGN